MNVVIEIDGPLNESLYFAPIQQKVRGRFDPMKLTGDDQRLIQKWKEPIPGQRLGLDVSRKAGFIIEPLHEERYAAIREQVEKVGPIPEPEKRVIADPATWVYWMKLAVDAGLARIVKGDWPKVEGKPQRQFITVPAEDPIDRLTAAIEKQTELLAKILK